MAKSVHASNDVWYHSVEDLLTALDTGNAGAASAAFVINLQTSAVPLDLGLKASLQFEGLHVYRLLHRLDNGLPQFQLRLGIIESDLEADAILATVRAHYPGATKKPVGDADRTAIARMVSSARSKNAAGSRHPIADPAPRAPSKDPAQRSTEESGELRSIVDKIGALTVAAERRDARAGSAQIARPARPAQTAQTAQMAPPDIDSTRTVRALTSFELVDESEASRWFVLQLMQSQEQIDPEQVPDLDIFSEYRLYAVGEADPGGVVYALRLGFFSSDLAAGAVASYLAPHFPTTDIKRVSLAEHERFAQNRVVAKKDVGLAGRHAVIEFASPRALPAAAPDNTASIGGNKHPPQASASLWSRLISRRVPR